VSPANDPSSLPLYLIGAGVLLMIGWGVFLYRIRSSSSDKTPQTPPDKPTVTAPSPLESLEAEDRFIAEESESVDSQEFSSVTKSVSTLGDAAEPFVETPDITRDSFVEFATRRVLAVEDNPVNRKLIETLLAGSGIDLETAVDGVEALEMLRAAKHPFEVVLMDVNMPRMDGLECTRQIRKDPKLSSTCVLALTASTTPEEVEAIVESGMDGYLEKPIVLGQLYTAFSRCFSRERGEIEEQKSPVLDERKGLEFTNGDRELYQTILEDFLQRYEQAPDEFARLIKEKDLSGLKTLIIDLEGLSGTMGASELYKEVLKIKELLEQAPIAMLQEYEPTFRETFERLKKKINSRIHS